MKVSCRMEAKVVVERSRFFAALLPAETEAEVLTAVKAHAREHRRAVHHCWAYRLRAADGTISERSRDDGEVGHPGRVLLELLRGRDVEGALVVSRIFGGVKLGVGGVSRAFREAGEAVLAGLAPDTRSPHAGPDPARRA